MADSSIPVQAILKLVIDRSGSAEVDQALKNQDTAFGKIEQTTSKIGSHLDVISKSVAGLAGLAGVGAVVDKFIKLETSASNVALAMGKITGGSGAYHGIGQEMLGVQSRTGVSVSEQEAALRALASSVGLSPKPGQAGMLAEVIAGYSKVTGLSATALGSILGPMLQAEGRGSSSTAAAYTLGEARANLTNFPGSQIESVLPGVSALSSATAIGGIASHKAGDVAGIAAMVNAISGKGSPLRGEAATSALASVAGTVQGAPENPALESFMNRAGVGYFETLQPLGNTATMQKIIAEANRQIPGDSEQARIRRNELYRQIGGGVEGAAALERLDTLTSGGKNPIPTVAPPHGGAPPKKPQTEGTPEATLSKLEAKGLGILSAHPLASAVAGAAALLFGKSALSKGVQGIKGLFSSGVGEDAAGDAAGVGIGAGSVLGGAALLGIGLLLGDPEAFGGSLRGSSTGSQRQGLINSADSQAVSAVAAAAQKKFGAGWNSGAGRKWMEAQLRTQGSSSYNDMIRANGEGMLRAHPEEAIKLLQQALGATSTSSTENETQQFAQAVKKFSEAIDKISGGPGSKNASYSGGLGAGAVASMASTVPGMVMAAYLGGAHGGASGGAGGAYASYTGGGGSSSWNAILEKYSNKEYGQKGHGTAQQYVEGLAAQNSGGGSRRATVEADAKKYGIPFNILWGIYGAESSFGKAKSNFGLTGQFPGTGTSGNFGTDARMSAEDLAKLAKAMSVTVNVHVGSTKVEQHKVKIKGAQQV